jgi:hypothetical protein
LNYLGDKGFLKDLASHRRILQEKISPKVPWKWDETASKAVQKCKGICKELPRLYLAKACDLLILNTDASKETWGAVLQVVPNAYEEFKNLRQKPKNSEVQSRTANISGEFQIDPKISEVKSFLINAVKHNGLRLSKWVSGTFSKAQMNYTVHEKETLALINALKKFKIDLLPVTFIFQTDSTYTKDFVKYKVQNQYNQGRLLRWSLEAQQFNFVALHIQGKDNSLADTLTREWKRS